MLVIDLVDYPEYYNLTADQLLKAHFGVKHLPLAIVVPLTVAYVTIFLTGLFGNVITCLVIIRKPTMQTATNYYLISLAISDLTLLVLGLPNELSVFWQQYPWVLGEEYCKIRAYVSEMSSYVSVLTIVAFSMERYLAICHPLHLYAMSGLKRPIRFIVGSWMVGLLCAIPFAIYTDINYLAYPIGTGRPLEESAVCAMVLVPDFPLYETCSIGFFIVPMVVILVLYTRMGLHIRRSNKNSLGQTVGSHVHGESRQIQSRKSVIKMLSAVVIMFFVCWAPFHAQRLLYVYGREFNYYYQINELLYTSSGCLYYLSTTVNPILYNVMSAKYRSAFKEMLCCSSKGNKPLSRDTSSLPAESTAVCQCNARDDGTQLIQIRSPRYPCSIRCTISHAKDILRTPGKAHGNTINNATPRSKRLLVEQDSANEHLLKKRASDNGKGSDRRALEPSDSTASSIL